MPTRNIRDGTLTIKSGDNPTPLTKVITLVDGGLRWEEGRSPLLVYRDRGVLDHMRLGPEVELTGEVDFFYQDDDVRDTVVNLDFAGSAGQGVYSQPVYVGWINPETDAAVLAGATMFGRTIQSEDVVAGSNQYSDAPGFNLLFSIDGTATGGTDENVLFMGVQGITYRFEEAEEGDRATVSFTSIVKQPHIY